jgi:hypothetical protein
MSPPSHGHAGPLQRFAFVEGLRGFAGIWVVLHHFTERLCLSTSFGDWAGAVAVVKPVILTGTIAVDQFFIWSGFVIAYSIGRTPITGKYAANFALRRSVRLDLPYWAILLIAIGCGFASRWLLHDSQAAVPGSWREVATNAVYLQTLCGYKSFLPVAWTLCIEFQFYLFLLATLATAQAIAARFRRRNLKPVALLAVALTPLAAYSVLVRTGLIGVGVHGLVSEYWFLLHLGLLAAWVHTGQMRDRWLLGYAAVLIGCFTAAGDVKSLVATLLGMTLYAASRTGYLVNGLDSRPLQYLGRISFSVYLVHMVLGMRVLNLMARLGGATMSPAVAVLVLLLAVAVSLVTADVFNRFVEQPSQRLSRRFRLRRDAGPVSEPRTIPVPPQHPARNREVA